MGVMKRNDMVNTAGEEKFYYAFGGQLIAYGPSEFLKPTPDGRKEVVRKEVNMGINDEASAIRYIVTFSVVDQRKRCFQQPVFTALAGGIAIL
jgi:hypothetical protein